MLRFAIPFALCGLAVTGCVSRPDRAELFIETAPPGAECTLTRDGGPIASVAPTPGIALVTPGPGDIAIDCRRSGFREASVVVHARDQGPSLGEALGGSLGHYEYDNPVALSLVPQ